jgi:NADH-quinone oxidoreductase subunit J
MIIFFILAMVAVLGAVMVVTRKNPLSSAIYLILVMCSIAGLFAFLGALFIAALQVIVYAGAIMVVVIFVIMLLNLRQDEFIYDRLMLQKYLGFAFAVLVMIQAVFITGWAMRGYTDVSIPDATKMESVEGIESPERFLSAESVAETLFNKYAYPFEITSVLLLAAIVGAMVISKRKIVGDEDEEELI